MPEGQLTIVRDDAPEIVRVKGRAQTLADEIKDLAGAKPSLMTMRAAASLLERTTEWAEFIHGSQDTGIREAHQLHSERIALRTLLLRLPLDLAFGPNGPQRGMLDAASVERQLVLIPKRAIADSKNMIEQKKAQERRADEERQRKAGEAERVKEVEYLEAAGSVEAAADLKAAPLPPVVMPVAAPIMPDLPVSSRYLVEGVEVTSYKTLAQWIGQQTEEMAEKFINHLKSSAAAYLNATAGAEIPGIKATKTENVIDRRK